MEETYQDGAVEIVLDLGVLGSIPVEVAVSIEADEFEDNAPVIVLKHVSMIGLKAAVEQHLEDSAVFKRLIEKKFKVEL